MNGDHNGVAGKDVLREQLRRLCAWDVAAGNRTLAPGGDPSQFGVGEAYWRCVERAPRALVGFAFGCVCVRVCGSLAAPAMSRIAEAGR